jgi:hypothetical protein
LIVHSIRAAPTAPKITKILHLGIRGHAIHGARTPEKRAVLAAGILGCADYLIVAVYPLGLTADASQGTQVGHVVPVEESMLLAAAGVGPTHHVRHIVDAIGETL